MPDIQRRVGEPLYLLEQAQSSDEIFAGDANGTRLEAWRQVDSPLSRFYAMEPQGEALPWQRLEFNTLVQGASQGQKPQAHYVVETDIPVEVEGDFNAWYTQEHLPGLAAVPGTISAARYTRSAADQARGLPKYVAMYALAHAGVLNCPEWLAVRASAWSDRIRPHFKNTRRLMHHRYERTWLELSCYKNVSQLALTVLPSLACDAHVHVFGPPEVFPYTPSRASTPLRATKDNLFALHKHFGIERCVIVQSLMHGFDNSVVADAIAAGGGRYLGVALVKHDIATAELRALAAQGFRGVRFHFASSKGVAHLASGPSIDDVLALTRRLAEVDLHLQVHAESAWFPEQGHRLLQSAVPVVVDHMGRIDARLGFAHEHCQALARLLDHPTMHLKISGIDRIDSQAWTAQYAEGQKIAVEFLRRFPDQCVWGTDWPHPNHTHIPDDRVLFGALTALSHDPKVIQKLLVENPQKLYRFPT